MEATIILQQIETKQTKSDNPKTFWSATTSLGKMTIWKKEIADKLLPLVNRAVKIDYEIENGKYKTILGFIGEGNSSDVPAPIQNQNAQPMFQQRDYAMEEKRMRASTSISYAKDLVVAGKITVEQMKLTAKEIYALQEELVNGQQK